jgi:hypothetical protein
VTICPQPVELQLVKCVSMVFDVVDQSSTAMCEGSRVPVRLHKRKGKQNTEYPMYSLNVLRDYILESQTMLKVLL